MPSEKPKERKGPVGSIEKAERKARLEQAGLSKAEAKRLGDVTDRAELIAKLRAVILSQGKRQG